MSQVALMSLPFGFGYRSVVVAWTLAAFLVGVVVGRFLFAGGASSRR